MSRFVILEHDYPVLHWDFMLEEAGRLAAWRLPAPPADTPLTLEAEKIGDHRVFYLDYEGPVSGGRGNVTRWDTGVYATLPSANDSWIVELTGSRWKGRVELKNMGSKWLLHFDPCQA